MTFRMTPFGVGVLALAMSIPQVAASNVGTAIEVSGAWANPTPPGSTVAAGYLEIKNRTDQPYSLVSVTSPAAQTVQIHSVKLQDGVARMRQVSSLPLPARGELKLAPGGNHLMLLGLKQRLVEGSRFPVRLRFSNGREINAVIQVKVAAQHQHNSGGHNGHH